MSITRNNYAFKGHKALLGNKYVTYGEIELPLRYNLYAKSENGFDWGNINSGAKQLSFSMLYQLTDAEFATNNAVDFMNDVVKKLNSRDWVLRTSVVFNWVKKHNYNIEPKKLIAEKAKNLRISKTRIRTKTNVVKKVCKELNITQKNLANILEVPEGTVSSWAVKNEIPRLGKKAIEFYIKNQQNQKIVDSYKKFLDLLNGY
jgi:DNA-binding transcriptional regulator YiaG